MKSIITAFIILLFACGVSYADTVILKSGKEVKGKIIDKTSEYIVLEFYGTKLTYYMNDIEKIVEDVPDGKINTERTSQVQNQQTDNTHTSGASANVQEPKGDTMEFVPFTAKIIDFPFNINYPAKWYVREEKFPNVLGLFISREPIRSRADQYTLGAGLYYMVNYLVSQAPPDSSLGKMAGAVIVVKDWEESKKGLAEGIKQQGNNIISKSDTTISGNPALKMECESQSSRSIFIFIKVGNNMLSLTFEAPIQEFEQYRGVFESMISSLSFK